MFAVTSPTVGVSFGLPIVAPDWENAAEWPRNTYPAPGRSPSRSAAGGEPAAVGRGVAVRRAGQDQPGGAVTAPNRVLAAPSNTAPRNTG